MANSRDFTGKNRKFTGTKGIITPKGTTGERVGAESGELRFNTTTELMEYYDGNQWKPIDAPPTISSISTSDAQGTNNILNADGSTLHTITITGGNFGTGLNVKFIGNTGTEYTAGNINRVSGSSITCTTLLSMGTADDPYDVQVINPSGLSATLEDAFSFNTAPVFVNASGTLGEVWNGRVVSGTTLNAGATDAEGNTITFTIISGSLPGSGLSISSSTGAITGTLSGTPSLGNYPFIVRASTTEGVIERQFSIQVITEPFSATGGTITTSGGNTIHRFNSSGSFVVSGSPGKTASYLIVGGGGGGGPIGGGGGAGGFRTGSTSITAQTYTIVVGGGGNSGTSGTQATNGVDSSAFGITSTGGGGGGNHQGGPVSTSGLSGGSGGGGADNGTPGGSGTAGQGTAGGVGVPGIPDSQRLGGGGGGAGQTGRAYNDQNGKGGDGTASSILGSSFTFAGGGGSSGYTSTTCGNGGTGGGGGGSVNSGTAGTGGGSALNPGGNGEVSDNGGAGTAGRGGQNTGGGGGGPSWSGIVAANGGSGIVIISYPT